MCVDWIVFEVVDLCLFDFGILVCVFYEVDY